MRTLPLNKNDKSDYSPLQRTRFLKENGFAHFGQDLYRTARARYQGQMIRANNAFHQISLAKAMVNIQPTVQMIPPVVPVLWTRMDLGFSSMVIFSLLLNGKRKCVEHF